MVRTRFAIMLAAVLIAAACASTQSGSSPEPIVGYWSWHDGVLQIKSVGSGSYEGSVAKLRTGVCLPPLGHVILKIKGSGAHYTGGDEWYRDGDCATQFSTDAKVDLVNGNQTANLCSSGPFTDVPPVSSCLALQRIANYKPSPGG
jgi:uncharacterized protein (DUF2147 family)